jgi:hypothetical protein
MSETPSLPSPAKEGEETDRWSPLDYPGGLLDGQWQRSQWNGLEQLCCINCPWDTLEGIEAAREHMQICPRCRPTQDEIQPSPILVADKNGKIISGG